MKIMFDFISENFILCITAVYVVLSFILSAKLSRLDAKSIDRYGKSIMEMPFKARVEILFRGKLIKIVYAATVLIFIAVLICRLEQLVGVYAAAALSIICSLLLAFLFLGLILVISALLRRLVSVNSASLNVMFSSVILILAMIGVNMMLCDEQKTAGFLLTAVCLVCCYVMMLFVLLLVLRETNDEASSLTLKNIWKSAFLTIVLFLFNLSLMSGCFYLHNPASFKGVEYGLFDMLYYTVITFATVGYGDITPTGLGAKAVSVLTVFTSILCITVLLSEIIGVKKKNKK